LGFFSTFFVHWFWPTSEIFGKNLNLVSIWYQNHYFRYLPSGCVQNPLLFSPHMDWRDDTCNICISMDNGSSNVRFSNFFGKYKIELFANSSSSGSSQLLSHFTVSFIGTYEKLRIRFVSKNSTTLKFSATKIW